MSFLSDLFTAGLRGEKAPDEPRWKKWVHRNLSTSHCEECLKLDGCWFLKEKTPRWPHHRFCHCILEDLPYNEVLTKATAESAYAKFDPYLFDPENFYKHGKAEMHGYRTSESLRLIQNEFGFFHRRHERRDEEDMQSDARQSRRDGAR